MAKKTNAEIRLGRLELQIMNVVWGKGKATVHEVRNGLGGSRKPAYNTILTMMRKLEAKGYLEHKEVDRAYVYRATIGRPQVQRRVLGEMIERLFDGSPGLLLNSLVEQKRISAKELREVQKLIREYQLKKSTGCSGEIGEVE